MKLCLRTLANTLGTFALAAGLVTQTEGALLVQYKFDEASSGNGTAFNTAGSLGSAADGVFNGTTTRTSSTPNNYSLGALSQPSAGADPNYVGPATHLSALGTLPQMTLTGWVNLQYNGGNSYVSLATDFSGGNAGWWWYFNKPNTGDIGNMNLGLQVNNAPVGEAKSSGTPVYVNASNAWVFVAAVWTGTQVTFYSGGTNSPVAQVGDVAALSATMTDPTLATVMRVANSPANVSDVNASTRVPGLMDDFRVYNTALTLADLRFVQLEDLQVPEPSTVLLLASGGGLLLLRRRSLSNGGRGRDGTVSTGLR